MSVDNTDYIEKMDFAFRFADKKIVDFTSQDIRDILDYATKHYLDKKVYWNDMVRGVTKDCSLSSEQSKFVFKIIKGEGDFKNRINDLALASNKVKMFIKLARYPVIGRLGYISMYFNHWIKTTF